MRLMEVGNDGICILGVIGVCLAIRVDENICRLPFVGLVAIGGKPFKAAQRCCADANNGPAFFLGVLLDLFSLSVSC